MQRRQWVECRHLASYVSKMSERFGHILSTAFERHDGNWVWYSNAWSRGVVVSYDERDLYLAYRPYAFRRAVRGRPATYPPRRYWPTVRRIVVAMISGRDPQSQPE
jgi:hypothetical protein